MTGMFLKLGSRRPVSRAVSIVLFPVLLRVLPFLVFLSGGSSFAQSPIGPSEGCAVSTDQTCVSTTLQVEPFEVFLDEPSGTREWRLDGRVLFSDSAAYVVPPTGLTLKRSTVYVIRLDSGGTACPSQFRIVRVARDDEPVISAEFGSCDPDPSVKLFDDGLSISFQKYRDGRAIKFFVNQFGVMRETRD